MWSKMTIDQLFKFELDLTFNTLCLTDKIKNTGYFILGFIIFLLSNPLSAQFVDTVTIQPRMVFQGEHFNGNKGVGGLEINIEYESISSTYLNTNSEHSVCENGIAAMDIAYHTGMGENEFDIYVAAPSNGQGMSVSDILKIQQYISSSISLDNYEFVAADANGNGVVDGTDVSLWQQANLNPTMWPSGGYWMVIQNIDKHNFESASQNNSLYSYGYDPMENISVYGDPSNSGTVDNLFSFRVNKKGDVNASNCYYCWNGCSPPSLLKSADIYVNLMDKQLSKVRLNLEHPNGLAGMQWFIDYDESEIEIINVHSDLPGFAKKNYRNEKGELRLMYMSSDFGDNQISDKGSYIELSIVSRNSGISFTRSKLHTNSIEIVDGEFGNVSDVSVEVSTVDRSGNTIAQDNQFYPNPVNNRLNAALTSDQKQTLDIRLVDTQGRVIYSNIWLMEKGLNSKYIEFGDFPSGVYFLQGLGNKGLSFHQKIVK